jgi:hypothetical protein
MRIYDAPGAAVAASSVASSVVSAVSSSPPAATIDVTVSNATLSRVSSLMTGSAVEFLNHQVYGGLYAQMVYGESFEEPGIGAPVQPPPPPSPQPPPVPPAPPGPPCAVSDLTTNKTILNGYCQTHSQVRSGGHCSVRCPTGVLKLDGCMGGHWQETAQKLCSTSTSRRRRVSPPASRPPNPGCPNPYKASISGMWQLRDHTSAAGNLTLVRSTEAFNGEFFQRLSIGVSLVNRGLYCESGMYFISGRTYDGSLYYRLAPPNSSDTRQLGSLKPSPPSIRVELVDSIGGLYPNGSSATFVANGQPALRALEGSETAWTRFDFTLTPTINSSCPAGGTRPGREWLGGIITCSGALAITVQGGGGGGGGGGGSVDLDMVTLMPRERLRSAAGNRMTSTRLDVAEALAAEGLTVIRMGGSMTAAAGAAVRARST